MLNRVLTPENPQRTGSLLPEAAVLGYSWMELRVSMNFTPCVLDWR